MTIDLLNAIRDTEIRRALDLFVPKSRVLELGGADGFQARLLADGGHEVESIDIATRPKRQTQLFPVQDYDGLTFPFPKESFNAVFSSNVLEHVPHLGETFREIRRVLRVGGLAVHILPTASWRMWTTFTHYPRILSTIPGKLSELSARPSPPPASSWSADESPLAVRSAWQQLGRALGLEPHGEYANAIVELYYFSKLRWEREFRRHGFRIVSYAPAGLFYTGHLLAPSIPIQTRQRLARVLGSACHVFVTA